MDFRDLANTILSSANAAFGEEVKFFVGSDGPFLVQGIFSNEYQAVDLDTQRPVSANQPTLGINLNDITFDLRPKTCEVEIRNIRYNITDKREDGQGGALLMLHRKNKNERIPDTKAN